MSRLSTNPETDRLRKSLIAKNLYTPFDVYQIDNPKLVDTINALSNIVLPFKSFDLTNTVIGRTIGTNTPIAQIGLIQLGKQFAHTVASQTLAEFTPTLNIRNLFDSNPNTRFVVRKIDYRITRDDEQTNFGRLIETLTGSNIRPSPFTPSSTLSDYIKNTGKGQLQILTANINRNFYRNSSISFYTTLSREGYTLNSVYSNPNGYFGDDVPYKEDSNISYGFGVSTVRRSSTSTESPNQNYGGSSDSDFKLNKNFVDNFGRSDNNNIISEFDLFDKTANGHFEDVGTQVVWGRDGADENTLQLQGKSRDTKFAATDISNKFNTRIGLLKYTSDLLNGFAGNVIDQTRKKFYKKMDIQKAKGDFVGFNGNALYFVPDNALPSFVGKHGIRQHTVLDQYNRFGKAIRYDGNFVYNGNPDSVVYDRVTPSIVPILNKSNGRVSKKAMFSIENLAFELNENGDVPVPQGTQPIQLPVTERGMFGGRIMWFAPYDINFEEQATAKWEQINFVGRNEPMYSYGFSERSGTLSFKLIIDYPPNIKGMQSHKEVADFFAFGGQEREQPTVNIGDKEKKIADNQILLSELEQKTVVENTKTINYPTLLFFFPNDYPKVGENLQNSIENIIAGGYEDGDDNTNIFQEGQDLGLNQGFVQSVEDIVNTIKQDETIGFLDIGAIGNATKLYEIKEAEAAYNQRLGERRANAMIFYIQKKIQQALGTNKTLRQLGAKTNATSNGSTLADPDTGIPANVNSRDSKESRFATLIFSSNGKTVSEEVPKTTQETQDIATIKADNDALRTEINAAKAQENAGSDQVFNPFTVDDGIVRGWDYIKSNKFVPVFYSQTPEDFHRRLTFLQQCVRQGAPLTNSDLSSSNSVFGRQPVCVLRLGDMIYTKVIIDSINFSYTDAPWDLNPEGMGAQYMIADITMSVKIIGGQSLKGPIDVLQNAISFNYYANSTYYNKGVYANAKWYENKQFSVSGSTSSSQ
ncbi:MAG: hypothetical protein HC836_28125 [Richelia sp. RM2_1_2]|nr:hypothetical protein [Richelia sp. RM2_1_2]